MLFYVVTLLALITETLDVILYVLSWMFVLSRIVHAYIHVTSNRLDRRGGVFGVGAIALLLMWVIVIARILLFTRPDDPAARASAAIEVLADIEVRKRPAAEALKDWGLAHRFAGSSDRAAIGNLVFDCLRSRASAAYAMGEAAPARARAAHPRHGLGHDAR